MVEMHLWLAMSGARIVARADENKLNLATVRDTFFNMCLSLVVLFGTEGS